MANKSRAAALTDSFSPSPHLDAARSLLEPLGDALHLPELAAALHKAGLTIPQVPAKTPPGLAARSVSRSDTPLLLPIRVGLTIPHVPAKTPPGLAARSVSRSDKAGRRFGGDVG